MDIEHAKGFLIGVTQNIIGHPLDTIKINIQSNKPIVIPKLYNGFTIPCMANGFVNFIAFSTYDFMYKKTNSTAISGFIAGIAVAPVMSPLDKIKIQLQNRNNSPLCQDLFKGLSLTVLRESFAFSLYFSSYNLYKDKLPDNSSSIMLSGGFAGMTSWVFTYPVDVIKTRVQNGMTYKQSIIMKQFYKGITICLIRSFLVNSVSFFIYEKL